MNKKYRRIIRNETSKLQSYQYNLIALAISITVFLTSLLLINKLSNIELFYPLVQHLNSLAALAIMFVFVFSICLLLTYDLREEIAVFVMKEKMLKTSSKSAKKIYALFNDKQIIDVLKLSNSTRYGEEMPQIHVYLDDNQNEGYVAIENISNYDHMSKNKYEQLVSAIFTGKYQRFSVVNSELTLDDSYMLFYFEDTLTPQRFVVDNQQSLKQFVSDVPYEIKLAKNLTWSVLESPHLSVISRTRDGKSFFAGRYLAEIMLLQGWTVEYNSAKNDVYVKQYNGENQAEEIVKRAEYWVSVMQERLQQINLANKEKYLEMDNMNNIGIFFDELGNLNASLELDKPLKKRWDTAINKLTATGASCGITVIILSQQGSKEPFLPSLARVNSSDAVIMLGMAADSADERRFLMSGFSDMPKRAFGVGQGLARIPSSGKKWEVPHFYETPFFNLD